MNDEQLNSGPGDLNVERLVREAYRPEMASAQFSERVGRAMNEAARAAAAGRRVSWWARPATSAVLSAAALVVLGIGLWLIGRESLRPKGDVARGERRLERVNVSMPATTLGATREKIAATPRGEEILGRVARQRPPATAPVLTSGQAIETKAGEKRRVTLEDGSTLLVNQGGKVVVESPRAIRVEAGEAFVEVAQKESGERFVVRTPGREVVALGTKFGVNVDKQGTGVVVTQGKVKVSGVAQELGAGMAVDAGGVVAAAPRASAVLDWTAELMELAQSPLVPASSYAGGALVAKNASGQESRLDLRKYHVDVHLEDGFARTTIDQTYFNHDTARLEGTFYFPLPPDAALSRLAMYVDGRLMEGGMAERDTARIVYETIVHTRKDPALLEWVDGSTFKMRVFPLEGRQEKRIIISYVQRLSPLYGRTTYRFPQGHSLGDVREWSFHARVKGGGATAWASPSHAMSESRDGQDLLLDTSARSVKVDRDVVLELADSAGQTPALTSAERARFSSQAFEGAQHLMLRYRPELAGEAARQRRDWVFLFESSAARDPLLARAQIDVVRTILENAEHDDTFTIVTAGTRTRTFAEGRVPATIENVRAAVEFLEKTHLVGAMDLGKALDAAGKLAAGSQNAWLVHVGGGIATLGERREDALVARVPSGVRYVGVGVGKRWSRQFMKTAAGRSGGYFTQINPDENVAWRAFDLLAALNTPRLMDLKVTDPSGQIAFLNHADSLAQGEELCVVTRLDGGVVMPTSLVVTGLLNGQSWKREVPLERVTPDAGHLPRTWAKLEIDRLLAAGAEANRAKIIELSKSMYVMSPFTSLLVLETEQMYEQFKVDRGRKDHWAMYPCPERINVVHEPLAAAAPAVTTQPAHADRSELEQCLRSILVRGGTRPLYWPGESLETPGTTAYAIHSGEQPTAVVNMPVWSGDAILLPSNGEGWIDQQSSLYSYWGVHTWDVNGRAPHLNVFYSNHVDFVPNPFLNTQRDALLTAGDFGNMVAHYRARGRDGVHLLDGGVVGFTRPPFERDDGWRGYERMAILTGAARPDAAQRLPDMIRIRKDENAYRFRDRIQAARRANAANDFTAARTALLDAEVARDQERVMYTADELAQFNAELTRTRQQLQEAEARWAIMTQQERNEATNQAELARPRQEDEARRRTVASLVERSQDQVRRRNYRQALGVLDQILVLDPNNDYARGARPLVYDNYQLQTQRTYRQRYNREVTNILNQAEEKRIPYEDLLRYPENWPEISELRDAEVRYGFWEFDASRGTRHGGQDVRAVQFAEFAVQAQLDRRLPEVHFTGQGFADVVDFLRDVSGANIFVNWRALEAAGINKEAPIHARMKDVRFTEALQTIVDAAGSGGTKLAYVIDDGVIVVAPAADIAKDLAARWRIARYEPPVINQGLGFLYDLVGYAPGFNTTPADVAAVVEKEVPAAGTSGRRGTIDESARKLIDRARSGGWVSVKLPTGTLRINGGGRFVLDRTTREGLREQVVCDGLTLWHLYPELGLAARREVSRFHRAQITGQIPWLVPPVEDLALASNVSAVSGEVVVLEPLAAAPASRPATFPATTQSSWRIELRFAGGRLAERRTLAGGKSLARQTYADDGTVVTLDGEGKELHRDRVEFAACDAPGSELAPDLKQYVVLPMPYRTREHVLKSRGLKDDGQFQTWNDEARLAVLASELAGGKDTKYVFDAFLARGDRRLGLYVILLSIRGGTNQMNVPDGRPVALDPERDRFNSDIARYADQMTRRAQGERVPAVPAGTDGGFGARMLGLAEIVFELRGSNVPQTPETQAAWRAKALAVAKKQPVTELTWAALRLVREKAGASAELSRATADVALRLADRPGFAYAARYEAARALHEAGDHAESRRIFAQWYRQLAALGAIPAPDGAFYAAFLATDDGKAELTRLLAESSKGLLERFGSVPGIELARLVRSQGQHLEGLAGEIFERAASAIDQDRHGPRIDVESRLAAVTYLSDAGDWPRAERMLAPLLESPGVGQVPSLWRTAAYLAEKRGSALRSAQCLERALDLEFAAIEGDVEIRLVRDQYGALLGRFEKLAEAVAALDQMPSDELVARVVRSADRWRALDPEPVQVCQAAARVLRRLGRKELAWDYLTTPLAERSNEAAPWQSLAAELAREGEISLADQAYATAFDVEPTNAQALWDRAQMLQRHGRTQDARAVYQKLAEGTWQPRFQGLAQQAKAHLHN